MNRVDKFDFLEEEENIESLNQSPGSISPSSVKDKLVLAFVISISLLAILFTILAGVGIFSPSSQTHPPPARPPRNVILVSLDGFRFEYLSQFPESAPNLMRMKDSGASAKLRPVFPSKTFPNHYSVVTGLYPESHGIVANTFYDPNFDQKFTISSPHATEGKWYGGEPIWNTVQKAGLKSASFFWPGSEAEINGMRPTYYKHPYNSSVPAEVRVAQVFEWLEMSAAERPAFICIYLSPVDSMGHEYGPQSPQVKTAIQTVDSAIGALLDGIEQRGKGNEVDLIVVGDHGMTGLNRERMILLEAYLTSNLSYEIIDPSPITAIRTAENQVDPLLVNLKKAPNIDFYKKSEIPERFHYRNNDRIMPIIGIAKIGFWVDTPHSQIIAGTHGYDNIEADMQTIFFAKGPSFRQNKTLELLPNLDLYEMICSILNVQPAPNNGTGTARELLTF